MQSVFITGGTGYMGRRLIGALLAGGHRVRALVRRGSESKVPPGAQAVVGDALVAASYADRVAPCDTLVQLVGVAHPAPMMKDYIAVRSQVEQAIRDAGLNATVLRPWYVLGPGHRWPYLLLPFYKVCELIPSTRASAERLGLVTLPRMVAALVHAVEHPAQGVRVLEVPQIRRTAFYE